MTPDLHPEELLDKAAAGTLTDPERARLDAHVSACAACRFAAAAREDFERLPMPELDLDQLVTSALTARASRSFRVPRRRSGALLAVAASLAALGSFAAVGQWTGALPRWIAAVATRASLRAPPAAGTAAPSGRMPPAPVEPIAPPPPAAPPTPIPGPEPVAPVAEVAPALEAAPAAPVASDALPGPRRAVRSKRAGTGAVARASAPSLAGSVTSHAGMAPSTAATVPSAGAGAWAAAGTSWGVVADGPASAAEAFAVANQLRLEGDRSLAMARYRELLSRWPQSPEGRQTRATLGRMLLDRGSPAGALEQLDAYLASGDRALEEEVLSARATALMRLGRVDDEARAWQTLLDRFPDSIHAPRARNRLSAIASAP